ncbi:undecaprenyl-diphosphatase [Halalkalibacter nanhaiisediminis]|uniref:Undecaprenyl-diphosphatase n=1 Tax=Halalkalibacter nanhaiisediminis TaxID=688079 RepID=A0A562QR49_9BACI|nr:undecaprenyl-diphosphatase [Halalkalibacter nanhaiisediminis]TWI59228.1 undecaprenyl-diphosphatase [Halalkalibacter nanhaiisediminis]
MDYKMFSAFNRLAGRYSLLDMLMILISNKVHYMFIFVLISMLFGNRSHKKVAYSSISSAIVTLFISFVIKLFSFKYRPFVKHRVGILLPSKTDSSFPSKHTLLVFAIATSIFLRERVLGSILLAISTLTGFSRIWVGHHYPSDIIGSAFISSMTGIIMNKTFKNNAS